MTNKKKSRRRNTDLRIHSDGKHVCLELIPEIGEATDVWFTHTDARRIAASILKHADKILEERAKKK